MEFCIANESEMFMDLLNDGFDKNEATQIMKELNENIDMGLNNTILKISEDLYITSPANSKIYRKEYGFNFSKMSIKAA